ncbi:MAG: pyridoxamine 5'-phosphate oxidase family protein [Candidatus Hodarchaeales archaeon]|jgi:nitroimidazol reductase NimA-like FMN-containing flavoprotein (pyridoxamine 5'-phosphate oxidase superfamily)
MREIRRKEKAIKDLDEIKDILIRTKYVTIAMSKSNSPYLVTLSHGYDKDKNCIYFHCASEGKKIEYLSDNNIIWGQAIDDMGYLDGKCNHAFKTAQFRGKVIFIDDYNEKKTALTIMINQLENNPEDILEKQLERESSISKVTIGRIDIEDLSGKVNLE